VVVVICQRSLYTNIYITGHIEDKSFQLILAIALVTKPDLPKDRTSE